MQAWIMTKLIRKKDIKEELWWVIPSRNMLRRVSLLHITVENFQIYTYFSFNEWERSIIWYKIKYLKKSRKKAEIEYILGDIVFGELGSCQLWQWHCIVVSRIHHGSQCHLNINDGFWILGWRFGGLCLTRNEWISIISRSLATENVPGRGESSVHLCLQLRLPLRRRWSWWTGCCRPPAREKPWTITVCLLGPAQWCPTAGDSAIWISRPQIAQPRVWK